MRLVALGFHLLYNQFAWSYDLVSWVVSLGEWRRWQLASLEFVSGPDLLEIAHGPGHMLVELHRRGFRVIGCDLSPQMGRLAHGRWRRRGLPVSPPLVRCLIPAIPFGEQAFDGILSQFPTPFITEPATLAALFRLLRPGGALVILPEGHLRGRGPLHRLIAWAFRVTGQTIGEAAPESEAGAAVAVWRRWQAQLAAAGFTSRIETITLERSVCTVIVADRPAWTRLR